jgi:hypothetical protein
MPKKENCWEIKNCQRQPGGSNASQMGVCPAAEEIRLDQAHGGKNAGRTCWGVAGTFCNGKVQGTFASKTTTCLNCHVYLQIEIDEDEKFIPIKELLAKLTK